MYWLTTFILSIPISQVPAVYDYHGDCLRYSEQIRTAVVVYKVVREQSQFNGAVMNLPADTVHRLNLSRDHSEKCTLAFDASNGIWKQETEDLRNVDAILRANQVPEYQRMNVSRSFSILVWSTGSARWSPDAHNLVIRGKPVQPHSPNGAIHETPLESGCLQNSLFDLPFTPQSGQLEGREVSVLTFHEGDQVLVFQLDHTIGYRYRRFERWSGNHLLEQKVASDYKNTGGIPYPFTHETFRWDPDGKQVFHERITVDVATFNEPLPKTALTLAICPGTVTDLRMKKTLLIRSNRVLDVESLSNLGKELEIESANTHAEEARKWRAEH